MKAKIITIVSWIFAAFFILMAIGGFSRSFSAGLLFLLAAFCTSPLFDKIPMLNEKLKGKKAYRIVAVIVLFFAGLIMFPTDDKGDDESETIPDRSIVIDDTTTEPEITETIESTTTTTTSVTTESATTTSTTAPSTATTTTTSTTTATTTTTTTAPARKMLHFVLNTESNCVHISENCSAAKQIEPVNRQEIDIYEDDLGTHAGVYWACGKCSRRYRDILYPLSDD